MARISALSRILPQDVTGTELVPVVKGGKTRSAAVSDVVAPAVQPFVDAAEAASLAANMARDQITDLVKPENIFVDVPLATAEAAVEAGTFFKLVTSAAGTAEVRERTAAGSNLLYTENTAAALRSADPVKGAALIGLPDGSTVQDALPRKRYTLKQMGVNYASTADQQTALLNAMTIASEDMLNLVAEPHAVYKHGDLLTFDGIEFDGQGCNFQALDPTRACIQLTGTRPILRNLRKSSLGVTARTSAYDAIGVLVRDATDLLLENIIIDSGANAGIALDNVQRFESRGTLVMDTKADAFHCTNGTRDGSVYGHTAIRPGDDGFAVVTYGGSELCENIRVYGARIRQGKMRGMTVVGGRDVWFMQPDIDETECAGIYFSSESSYGTYGVRNCGVIGGTIKNAVSRAGISQGAIHCNGRSGSLTTPSGEVLTNTVEDIVLMAPKIRGCGEGIRAGVTFDDYAIGLDALNIDMKDIRISATQHPRAFALGGKNITIKGGRIANIGGQALTTVASLAGYLRINDLTIEGVCVDAPDAKNVFLFNDAAPGLEVAEIERVHMWKRGAVITAPFNYTKLTAAQRRFRNNLLDGAKAAEPPTLAKSGTAYQIDLESGVYAEGIGGVSASEATTIAADETLAIIVKPSRNVRYTWMANRQSDYSKLADVTISGAFTYSLPSGTAGIDYVAIGAAYYRLTVVNGTLNGANVASQAIAYDAATGRVTITYTPISALNARVQIVGVG
ncbi:hypothetical protein [uncultured Novosphingobium sp.]|uniref:hypothetical protein n=1 Tax=uncultured Novosphingobium sp. TaxID=292277 RepID=UPI0025926C4A|nr:hypothetical protein [uncultured Novosphingobium sp.]